MSSWFDSNDFNENNMQVDDDFMDESEPINKSTTKYLRDQYYRKLWVSIRDRERNNPIPILTDTAIGATFKPQEFKKYLYINSPKEIADFYANREMPKQYKFGAEVKEPEIQPLDAKKCELTSWPKNTFLRIQLHAHYKRPLQIAIERIKTAVAKSGCLEIARIAAFPTKMKRFLIVCSPTIDKRSKDHYEIRHHRRMIDIYPKSKITNINMNFKKLLLIHMPLQVKYESWFQEVNRPLKASIIHDRHEMKWVSRYYLYNRDKQQKANLVNEILQEDNKKYMRLGWPKDFYSLYKLTLAELKSMLRKINDKRYLEKQYEIFDIQRPNIRHLVVPEH